MSGRVTGKRDGCHVTRAGVGWTMPGTMTEGSRMACRAPSVTGREKSLAASGSV